MTGNEYKGREELADSKILWGIWLKFKSQGKSRCKGSLISELTTLLSALARGPKIFSMMLLLSLYPFLGASGLVTQHQVKFC